MTSEERRALLLDLVQVTVQRAARVSRYYAGSFEGIDLNLRSLEAIRRLPLLSRKALRERSFEILVDDCVPEFVRMTSGTTFEERDVRAPLLLYRTVAEREAHHDLLNRVRRGMATPRPLALNLVGIDHGVDYAAGSEGCFLLPLEKEYHYSAVVSVLSSSFPFHGYTPRVQVIAGSLNLFKLFTLLCMERGVKPSSFEITSATTYSWFLTSRWRNLLESYWGTAISDVYGLSEAPGVHATRCNVCRHYHFAPLALIEVLHPTNDEPVEEGVGRLVVTSLFPLSQAQPIIRYDTEDLVSVVGVCTAAGEPSIDFVGRRKDVVLSRNSATPLMWPGLFTEVLDNFPDIATHENPRSRAFDLRSRFGWPKYAMSATRSGDRTTMRFDIELKWSAKQYPQQAEEFRRRVTASLLEASPSLATSVGNAEADVELHFFEPGDSSLAALF